MKITEQLAPSMVKFVPVHCVREATHFRNKSGASSEFEITAVCTIVPRNGLPIVESVLSNRMERRLFDITLLASQVEKGKREYHITLSEGEAQVLAEVLRRTRVGPTPHKDVQAVCCELWGNLPTDGNTTMVAGAPIHVSKA